MLTWLTSKIGALLGALFGTERSGPKKDDIPMQYHLSKKEGGPICGKVFLQDRYIAWRVENLLALSTQGDICQDCLAQVRQRLQDLLDLTKVM